jgi:hypothetical protein
MRIDSSVAVISISALALFYPAIICLHMSEHVQCPNCGSYKVTTKSKIKGYAYKPRPMGTRIWMLNVAAFAGLHLLLMVELMYVFRVNLGLAAIVVAVFAALILWEKGVRSRLFKRMYLDRIPVDGIYRHICVLCTHQWVWRTGTQKPEIHVRPELVLKGAERLWGKRRRRRQSV